jgi:hypothetical protein
MSRENGNVSRPLSEEGDLYRRAVRWVIEQAAGCTPLLRG